MIRLTDINGQTHLLALAAIAQVTEAGVSGQWHGIKSYVRTFDHRTLEVRQTLEEISRQIEVAAFTPVERMRLTTIYARLLAGDFYEDHDRASQMVGWLRELTEKHQ